MDEAPKDGGWGSGGREVGWGGEGVGLCVLLC